MITYSFDHTGGLADSGEITVALDEVFADLPQWEEIIREALAGWSNGTGITFVEVPDSEDAVGAIGAQGTIRLVAEALETEIAHGYAPPNTGAVEEPLSTSRYGDVVYSTEVVWSVARLTNVTAHEVGHALGLVHTLNPESVMYWMDSEDNVLTPSEQDLADLRAIYCPLNDPAPILTVTEVDGPSDWFALTGGTAEERQTVTLAATCQLVTSGEQKTGVKGVGVSLAYETYGFDHVDLTLAEGGRIETDGANAYGIAAGDYNTLVIDGTIVTAGSSSDGVALFGGGNQLYTSTTSVIRTSGDSANGIYAGIAYVDATDLCLPNELTVAGLIETSGTGAAGIYAFANASVSLTGEITTTGWCSAGIASDQYGGLQVDVQSTGTITTTGEQAYGILVRNTGNTVTLGGQIVTSGDDAAGLFAYGDANTLANTGTIATTGDNADGLYSYGEGNTLGNSGTITTTGDAANGLFAYGEGNALTNTGTILTAGYSAQGCRLVGDNNSGTNQGTITSTGETAHGLLAIGSGNQLLNAGEITTTGTSSFGLAVSGTDNLIVNTGRIATSGTQSHGIVTTDDNVLRHSGSILVSGADAIGIWARGSGSTVDLAGTVVSLLAEAIRLGGARDPDTGLVLATEATGNLLLLHGATVIEGDIVNDGADDGATVYFGAAYDADAATAYSISPLTLVYTGSFTGHTWVGTLLSGSTVFLEGESNAFSLLTVEAGATLAGTTTLSGSLVNAGVVSPGNSVGTLVVEGSYEQTTGGTLLIELGGGTQTDALIVGGDATFAADSTVAVSESGLITGGSYAVLTTAGTLGGTPLLEADDSVLLHYSLATTDEALLVEVARTAYADIGATANRRAVGAALDRLLPDASGTLADALLEWDGLTQDRQVQEVLTILSPSCYAALADETFFAIRHLTGDSEPPPAATAAGWAGYASYAPLQARRHADADVAGYRIQGGALRAGVTRTLGSLRLDLSLGYREGQISHDGHRAHSETDGMLGALGLRSDHGRWYAAGHLGGGRQWHDSWRAITGPALAYRAKSRGAADVFFGGIEGGGRLRLGPWTIGPFLALDHASIRQEGFVESGAEEFATTVLGTTAESLRSSVGCRLGRPVQLAPRLPGWIQTHLAWGHEFADPTVAYDAVLAGERFSVRGREAGREQWRGGLALQVAMQERVRLGGGLDYERQGSDHGVVLRGSVVHTF